MCGFGWRESTTLSRRLLAFALGAAGLVGVVRVCVEGLLHCR